MPSFQYNPYTQPPRSSSTSWEDSLKQLICVNPTLNPPSPSAVQLILEHILLHPDAIEWTVDLAEGLAVLVLALFDSLSSSAAQSLKNIPDGSLGTFFLLASVMQDWSDHLMYMVLLKEGPGSENPTSLLNLLLRLAISDKDPVHNIAIVALGAAYRSMDRLHQYLTLDPYREDRSWWLKHLGGENLSKLTSVAMKNLRNSAERIDPLSQPKASILPTTEQIQLGSMSCLCTILKRDLLSSLEAFRENEIGDLCTNLLRRLQVLVNPQLPSNHSRWYLPCALMSVTLVSLIQWRFDIDLSDFDRIVHSTTLVENVTTCVFSSFTGNFHKQESPRWTYDEVNSGAQVYGLDVMKSWALSGAVPWSVFTKNENQWRPAVERFWNDVENHQTHSMAVQIPHVAWLQHSCRLISRGALFSIFQRVSEVDRGTHEAFGTNLLTSLFDLCQSPKLSVQISAVSLIRSVLSDRRSLITHDDVSRAFWGWIDDDMTKQVIQLVISLSKSQRDKHPLLLALLDLLDTILQDQAHCDTVLKYLSAESLEQILSLVEPKKVKFDYKNASDWEDLSLDIASETPPANNLSRMDENSICFEQEDESCPRGLDITIQLSAATAMARLGNIHSSSIGGGIHLLKSRICTAVNNFVAHFLANGEELDGYLSFDSKKRSLRLQVALAGAESEDLVVTALFSNEMLKQKRLAQLANEKERATLDLRSAEKRSQDLQERNSRLTSQNRSQSIIFNREMSRMKENTSQDAKQLVAIHATERSNAENRVAECVQHLDETESELQNARLEAEESQRTAIQTKKELQNALATAASLENERKKLSRQIDEEEVRARELQEEIHSQTEKLDSLFRSRQDLEDELRDRNVAVEDCEAANETLRDNLEELFADMVSLTNIYEVLEGETANLHRNHHDDVEEAERKLRHREERNEELTSTVDQLRQENDKLYKKLAKYKERLEDERQERKEEASRRKRNGPVSYINQLHQSTTSDRSVRDRSTSRKESGSSRSRVGSEKENSYNYASASQRRSHY